MRYGLIHLYDKYNLTTLSTPDLTKFHTHFS